MKNWKTQLALALILSSSIAQADQTYKWVELSPIEMNLVSTSCMAEQKANKKEGTILFISAGALVAGGVLTTIRTGPAGTLGIGGAVTKGAIAGVPGVVSAGTGTADIAYVYLNFDEVSAVVSEQQSGKPGLMSEALEQMTKERGLSIDVMLASLNKAAIKGRICDSATASDLKLKSIIDKEEETRAKDELMGSEYRRLQQVDAQFKK